MCVKSTTDTGRNLSPSPQSPGDNTGAVVGGVVAVITVVAIVAGVVIITYLVLRHKRGGAM